MRPERFKIKIVRQSVLHVHNVFCKKWAPLAEFIMSQNSWVQTHRLLPIALSLLYDLCYLIGVLPGKMKTIRPGHVSASLLLLGPANLSMV